MKGILYLADGTKYIGKGFGATGTCVGELVFNTAMTGYEEILTDPSYAGQIINMTYPLIGNYGISRNDRESSKIYAKGFIVKSICNEPSNYLSENNLDSLLKSMNIVGIYGVDTRKITKKIRNSGSLKCVISTEDLSLEEIQNYLENNEVEKELVKQVSTNKIIHIKGTGEKIAVLDLGAKENIIRSLKKRNCDITILPYNTKFEKIMNINPDGILLSNGPGDPKDVPEVIETVKKLAKVMPVFGICLGHQILSLAMGANTYKMRYGHRGGNHGVYDIEQDKAFITSQNHGYAVEKDSIKNKDIEITHINLNDNTVEGIKHKTLPVFSVQFHPEGAPGPEDTVYLFDKFLNSINTTKGEKAVCL